MQEISEIQSRVTLGTEESWLLPGTLHGQIREFTNVKGRSLDMVSDVFVGKSFDG